MNWRPVTWVQSQGGRSLQTTLQFISAGMGAGYGSEGRGSVPESGKVFFLFHSIPTTSWTHCLLFNGCLRLKSGRGVNLTTSIWYQSQEGWSYVSALLYIFKMWCLIWQTYTRKWIHYQCSNIIYRFTFYKRKDKSPPKFEDPVSFQVFSAVIM